MHMHQCICLCSFVLNHVLRFTWTSATGRGLNSLAFCCVRSYTCSSACFEPALASLYSQWSSVIHMHVDPLYLL